MFPVHTHLKMLADRHRIAAYKKGILDNIRPGDIVADIGTGTGILAFLALQAGAARVYALEFGAIIETARKIAADNGFLEKIVFINKDSREARLPEKVDVIITETFGGMGIDEGTIDILVDARERFLKPGGVILPECLHLWALPVHFHAGHPFMSVQDAFKGLETGSLIELARHTVFSLRTMELESCQPVGESGRLFTVNFLTCRPMEFPMKMRSPEMGFTGDICDGVVVYPELVFPGEASLALFDGCKFIPTHWELAFFPNQDSLRVDSDDTLEFHLTVTRNNDVVWKHLLTHQARREVSTHVSVFGLPSLKSILKD